MWNRTGTFTKSASPVIILFLPRWGTCFVVARKGRAPAFDNTRMMQEHVGLPASIFLHPQFMISTWCRCMHLYQPVYLCTYKSWYMHDAGACIFSSQCIFAPTNQDTCMMQVHAALAASVFLHPQIKIHAWCRCKLPYQLLHFCTRESRYMLDAGARSLCGQCIRAPANRNICMVQVNLY